MYLEYLDTDKMRSKADKSIWNIWMRKEWEAKLKILNEMQMLHLPLKLSHSELADAPDVETSLQSERYDLRNGK